MNNLNETNLKIIRGGKTVQVQADTPKDTGAGTRS